MKFLLYLLFVFFLFSLYSLQSKQNREYEYWGDEYFTDTTITNEFEQDGFDFEFWHISYGFFPNIKQKTYFSLFFPANGWDYSTGDFLVDGFSSPFRAQPNSGNTKKQMTEKKNFSDEDKQKWHNGNTNSTTNIFNIGISVNQPISLFGKYTILAELGVGYKNRIISGFSDISSVQFLDHYGIKKEYQTMQYVEISDKHCFSDFSIKFPIYGTNETYYGPNSKIIRAFSIFYYISCGVEFNHTFSQNVNVYDYILTQQNLIRYPNGNIRQASIFNEDFNELEQQRWYWTVGIGWYIYLGSDALDMELKYKSDVNPTIKNSAYRQEILYGRVGVPLRIVYSLGKMILGPFF